MVRYFELFNRRRFKFSFKRSTFVAEKVSDGQLQVSSVDVCMLGLRGILPLMSVETLKFPTLCSRFYSVSTCLLYHFRRYLLVVINSDTDYLILVLVIDFHMRTSCRKNLRAAPRVFGQYFGSY